MRLNVVTKIVDQEPVLRTHEGAAARAISAEDALRRSVMSCLLWESEFYEDGVEIADRIRGLVPQVAMERVAAMAIEAREQMKLRHVPLLLVREMARHASHRKVVAVTLTRVIQRADELAEFLAIYWSDEKTDVQAGERPSQRADRQSSQPAVRKQPLSGQVKKGLASAFTKFDEYALAKYDRAGRVRLRDVLFLSHAKPLDQAQAELWKRLAANELATPDTWEVALSTAASKGLSKREVWERLLTERRLGALALLRNLRNMHEAQVAEEQVLGALAAMKTERILPFRFLAAARKAPQWEEALEAAMFRSLEGRVAGLSGHTVLLVDISGSMESALSGRSEMRRTDAAYGLAVLLREIAERVTIFTFSEVAKRVPARRGMALRDALDHNQQHGGTRLGVALKQAEAECPDYDRLVVITDEQSKDLVIAPQKRGYVINVASARNGVGYSEGMRGWVHVDGFSDAVVDYIAALEQDATS